MKRHLFLTGAKHIGKSTIIAKLLDSQAITLGGFRTVRTNAVFPGHFSVHLLRPAELPSRENLLFICRQPSENLASRFDTLGCAALAESGHAQLLLMDELGPAEKDSFAFQQAILSALDNHIPILGVLQQADTPFLRQVAAHEAVMVVEVTLENRDILPELLRKQFHF